MVCAVYHCPFCPPSDTAMMSTTLAPCPRVLSVEFVSAGPRLGWRWTNAVRGGSCETIWLDLAPHPSDRDYDDYHTELKAVNEMLAFSEVFSHHLHMKSIFESRNSF